MCVLLCISPKYKLSTYCRSEAEYVYTKCKPFVPLIMKQGYKPDGWLKFLVCQRKYIDFCKGNFQDNIRDLAAEIQHIEESLVNSMAHPQIVQLSVDRTRRNECMRWTSEEVDKWLDEKHINEAIKEKISPRTGRVLYYLHGIQSKSVEFFHATFSNASFTDIMFFAMELNELFGG